MIFTIIYNFAGGTDAVGNDYIYTILDWNNAGMTSGIVVAVIVLALILHAFACLLQWVRVKFHKIITKNKQRSFDLNNPV